MGSDSAPTPTPDTSTPVASDIILVNKVANYTTLLVPGDFSGFSDKDGYAVVEDPDAGIAVTSNTHIPIGYMDRRCHRVLYD